MDLSHALDIFGVVIAVASAVASVLNSYSEDNKKNKKLAAASLVVNSAAINLDKVKVALGVLKGKK